MDIRIHNPETALPTDRAFVISMVIRSFKGRRDVDVHLFRPQWTPEESTAMVWDHILNTSMDTPQADPEGSMRVVLESFTATERDIIIDYLKTQYSTRLTAIYSTPLAFPIPVGLTAFTQISGDKSCGFIDFSHIPSYPLDIALMGYYDLSRHLPLVDDE